MLTCHVPYWRSSAACVALAACSPHSDGPQLHCRAEATPSLALPLQGGGAGRGKRRRTREWRLGRVQDEEDLEEEEVSGGGGGGGLRTQEEEEKQEKQPLAQDCD
jgi:hypothetical protein